MKTNKFLAIALFVAAISFAACDKKEGKDNPNPPKPNDSTENPFVEAQFPELQVPAGKTAIVIAIPEGTECNGIYLKGNIGGDGFDWSGANTYVGETAANVPAEEAIRFQAVPDWKNLFVAYFATAENSLEGKVCLRFTDDGSWEGQAIDVVFDDENTTVAYEDKGGGQFAIAAGNVGILSLKIGGWNKSECVAEVRHDYNVTFNLPDFCQQFDVEAIGDFDGWSGTAVQLNGQVATVTVNAAEGDKIKIRQVGSWDNQVQLLNEEDGTWNDAPDNILGAETNVTIDYSAGRWTVCAAE